MATNHQVVDEALAADDRAYFASIRRPVQTHRTLIRFSGPAGGQCDMGDDEDDCPNAAAYWLDAPGSYTVLLYVCDEHAADEHRYFGTAIPTPVVRPEPGKPWELATQARCFSCDSRSASLVGGLCSACVA